MEVEEEEEEETSNLGLYRHLLAINYYETIEPIDYTAERPALTKVPQTFSSVQEYIRTFEPLMLEEALALLQRGLVEAAEIPQPHRCVTGPSKKKDNFLVLQVILEPESVATMRPKDAVLLTKDDPEREDCRYQLNALAVVESRESAQSIRIRVYLPESGEMRQSERQRVQAMSGGLQTPNTGFYITPLASLSTIIREWHALHSIDQVHFKDILLSGMGPKDNLPTNNIPPAMEAALKLEYNESQMRALTAGLSGQQVVLIQGPPGTGKTRTLLGLLSIILHAAPTGSIGLSGGASARPKSRSSEDAVRLWKKSSPWLSGLTVERDTVKPWEQGSISDVFGLLNVAQPIVISRKFVPKAHVLVCAPSNSALDEIVIRLLASGILDRQGNKYAPSIARVGLKPHHLIQSVELENLVNQRLARSSADKGKTGFTYSERERIKMAVIEDAHIVCCTLSFAGSRLLQRISRPFDVVVIDEAAQAVEPAVLIPLCRGAKQVYLIGDPVQLPATVISRRAVSYSYDVSLFKRLQMNDWPVVVLDTQYRMHPEISSFPSAVFYQGGLQDGPGVAASTHRAWHSDKCLGPFAFFDVKGRENLSESQSSLVNEMEAEMVVSLYIALVQRYPELKAQSSSIAIISPYKAQVNLIKGMFHNAMGDLARRLDINTIDGFQGREKDIAIFSAVRSGWSGKIGFVADERRINVGLTRARCSMLVVGSATALDSDPIWHRLLRHARLQRKFFKTRKPFGAYLDKVIAGDVQAEGPTRLDLQEKEEEAPQAEDHVFEDEDAFSDSGPSDDEDPAAKRRAKPEASEAAVAKKAKTE